MRTADTSRGANRFRILHVGRRKLCPENLFVVTVRGKQTILDVLMEIL